MKVIYLGSNENNTGKEQGQDWRNIRWKEAEND